MGDFTEGLLTGFQFVEGLADRARRARESEVRLGLAKAADARAQGMFQMQVDENQRNIERQASTDEANSLLARAYKVGIENLQPYELQQLTDRAQYNPEIAKALQEMQYGQRDVEALQNVRGLGRVTTAASATQSQGNRATQSPSGQVTTPEGMMTPDQVTAPREEGLPPAADGGGLVTRHSTFMGKLLQDTLGLDLPPELVDKEGRAQLPKDLFDQLVAMKDMPVVQREQVRKQLRAQVEGKLPETVSFEKQQQAVAELDVNAWQAFVDGEDRGGSALRELAASSPSLITNKLHQDWNTIAEKNPNLLPSLTREMGPVVETSLMNSATAVRSLPVGEDGLVDMRSQEAKNAYRDFNNSIQLLQKMSDGWNGVVEGRIRGGSMPIGNKELNQQIMDDVGSTPDPALPSTPSERQARTTMARRGVESVANGGRNLSTKTVQSLAWLAKRGYITAAGLQHFLDTGTFTDPKDAKFFDHNPKYALMRTAPDGTTEMVLPPQGDPDKASNMFSSGQMEFLDQFFTGVTDDEKRQAEQWKTGFLVTLYNEPEKLGFRGMSSNDISKYTPGELSMLARRYVTFKHTESDFENGLWNWMLGRDFSDQIGTDGEPIDVTNYDDFAKKYGYEVDALPEPAADTSGYKNALSNSGDPINRALAQTLSDKEMRAIILGARAAQVNPPQ